MAESYSVNMKVESPQSAYSAYAAKGKSGYYKKIFISKYEHNNEENQHSHSKSPQIDKPMPPLEPMYNSHSPLHLHPKKRLQREHDDPMLSEAAASPSSYSDVDTQAQLRSAQTSSTPDSPYLVFSPTESICDSAYSSSSHMSDINGIASPGSATQASPSADFYPMTPQPMTPKVSPYPHHDPQPLTADTAQENVHQAKACVRAQSVALDLTHLPKQKDPPYYSPNPISPQQHIPYLVSAPTNSSTSLLLSEGEKMKDIRMGFQGGGSYQQRTINQINCLSTFEQGLIDRPMDPVMHSAAHSVLYPCTKQEIQGSVSSRFHKPLDMGGGVIRPRPRPPTHQYLHHLHHRIKYLQPQLLGGQRKRKPEYPYPNEKILREMPSVPLPLPTASEKTVAWLHDDTASPSANQSVHGHRDTLEYKDKLIKDWTPQDVVYFMIDSSRRQKSQDINVSELNNTCGMELCNKTIHDFRRYAPTTAEYLYKVFRKRVDEENRQQAAAQAVPYHHEMHNSTLDLHPSPFDFINQSNNVIHAMQQSPPHSLQPPPPPPPLFLQDFAGGCDASAPYELRYETIDAKSIGHDNVNRGPVPGVLPSASMKSFDLLQVPSPAVPFNQDDHLSDPDQSSSEPEVKPEPPKKRGPGRPRKPENELKKKKKKTGRLWEFIRNLLLNPETCPSLVRWENPEEGIFRFVQAEKVAQRWGERKKNKDMNYEKLSRAMRYYYKGEVFEAVIGRRLVYKFGKNAKDWRPSNPNFANHSHFPGSSFS